MQPETPSKTMIAEFVGGMLFLLASAAFVLSFIKFADNKEDDDPDDAEAIVNDEQDDDKEPGLFEGFFGFFGIGKDK